MKFSIIISGLVTRNTPERYSPFQERNLYGRGCPFLCPHVENPPVYRKGDLPVSEGMAEREFALFQPHLSPPCDEQDLQLIKVHAGLNEIWLGG